MLCVINMLKASADRKTTMEPQPLAAASRKAAGPRFDDIAAEAKRSRLPVMMKRATVRADITRMMYAFGVKPDNLSLYEDEFVEAEHTCALCRHVERCRVWSAKGCRGDAPRLFCANAALFEEITPDPFWSQTAPGDWHTHARTSPLLRLLASDGAALTEGPPRIGVRKLERFVDIASAIGAMIDKPTPTSEALDETASALRADAELDAAIDKLFDHQDGFGKADFARILQVALCDPRLAECLCHPHDRLRSNRVSCHV